MAFASGRRLGPYEILSPLGAVGMAAADRVLRAYVRSHARPASAREKRQALNRVRALRTYLDAVEQELGTRVGEVQKGVDAKLSHD